MDEYEGTVQFGINGKEYKAFFYGEDFEPGQNVEIELDHLKYPLEWDVIFRENKNKELKLEASNSSDWSYYGYGRITNVAPVTATFGDFELELGEWTNDKNIIGEFIYWKIERLELSTIKG